MLRTALVLLMNWSINTAIFSLTGNYTPWVQYLIIDAISAAIVLVHPAGRMQATIGITYIIACIWHAAYGLTVLRAFSYYAQISYWEKLRWIALAQILLMGGWIIGRFGKRCFAYRPSRHHQAVAAPHFSRME